MFFEEIYGSWHAMQERKYRALFRLLGLHGINGRAVDVGSGRERDYPFPAVRVDINPGLRPDVVASGLFLPFKDNSFDIAISIDSAHLFNVEELFRVARHVAIALPERLYRERLDESSLARLGELVEKKIIDLQEREIISIWKKLG